MYFMDKNLKSRKHSQIHRVCKWLSRYLSLGSSESGAWAFVTLPDWLSEAAWRTERFITDRNWNGRHCKGRHQCQQRKKCDKSSWKVCLQIVEGLEFIDCLANHQEIGWFIHSFNILLFYNDITSITYWNFRKNSFGLNM